jgi:hypothetical protein
MLFVDWFFVMLLVAGVIIVAASIFGIRSAAKMRTRTRRVLMLVICVPIGAIASLSLLLMVAGSGCVTHSSAIYSPSGKVAARVENADEGATGGSTAVELFWAHGFKEKTVYQGGWKSVEPSDIQWISNTQLTIHYSSGYSPDSYNCASAGVVKVTCLPR